MCEVRKNPRNEDFVHRALAAFLAFMAVLFAICPVNNAHAEEEDSIDVRFIEQMANAAGMTPGDFVVTVATAAGYESGIPLFSKTAKFSQSLVDSLGNLVDAADYPEWDTLTSDQQAVYGSKKNYDARKFNSLMSAVGYGDTYDGFVASGGGSLDLGGDIPNKLGQIGRIGALWMSGAAVLFGQLAEIVNGDTVSSWVPQVEGGLIDGSGIDGWPQGVPQNLLYYDTLTYKISSYYYTLTSNTGVVKIIPFNTHAFLCSTSEFRYGTSSNRNGYVPVTSFGFGSSYQEINGKSVYVSYVNIGNSGTPSYEGVTSNGVVPSYLSNVSNRFSLAYLILYGGAESGNVEKIEGYPEEEPSDDTPTYFPAGGNSANTTWPQITTPPGGTVAPAPQNPYNPGNQTGGNQWANETTQNTIPLLNLPFDRLFPFCLLYDVPLLLGKILDVSGAGSVSAQAVNRYNVITLRIPALDYVGLPSQEIELDLQPLEEIITTVRPMYQILLLVLLLYEMIAFFKAIITG